MAREGPIFIRGPHGWLEAKGKARPYAAAATGGALANLGYAPLYFFPATAAGLIILVWLLDGAARREQPLKAAFARAWTFAFFYFLFGLYWVFFAFTNVAGAMIFAVPAVIALPAGLALFWGGAAAAAIRFWSTGPRRLALFALAIMAAEWARGHLFGGFPWNLPGYVWPAGSEISQTAAFAGIYGLSAITVLLFAAPATFADAGRLGYRAAPSLMAALSLGLLWGAGGQRLAGASDVAAGPIVRVADAGFTQREKWRDGNQLRVFRGYERLLDGPTPSNADIDIWPESAMPFLLLDQPDALAELGEQLGDRVLVLGVTREEQHGGEDLYYNSAAVLVGVGGRIRVGQIYDKSRLVPFGEFIPLWPLIAPFANGLHLKALQEIGSGFTPGEPPQRIVIPGAGDAAIMICYEAIFPSFAPRGVDRPAWLINVSNDAWFTWQPSNHAPPWLVNFMDTALGSGPRQHFNQARYRTIEEGLPLARAASGGISAIVDAYGHIVTATGLHGGAVEAPLPAALPPTFFASHSAAISFVVFLVLAALAISLPDGQAAGGSKSQR